jgi:hypothetical protein
MHGIEAKGRKMDWNRPCISKKIIEYKDEVEGLEREKQLWLHEYEIRK